MPRSGLVFSIVDPAQGLEAYQWHRGFAAANEHLFPRTWEQYEALALDGRIISARGGDGNYVGLAYFNLEDAEWEIGGLMVSEACRGHGIGSTLMRLTLGHVLFEEDPLDRDESIIAHVHAENDDPRPLMDSLKFRHRREIRVDGKRLPGLKTDAEGMVNGAEYELTIPESLDSLADWCEAWKGKMRDGECARVELRPDTNLHMWAAAFREMARKR